MSAECWEFGGGLSDALRADGSGCELGLPNLHSDFCILL